MKFIFGWLLGMVTMSLYMHAFYFRMSNGEVNVTIVPAVFLSIVGLIFLGLEIYKGWEK